MCKTLQMDLGRSPCGGGKICVPGSSGCFSCQCPAGTQEDQNGVCRGQHIIIYVNYGILVEVPLKKRSTKDIKENLSKLVTVLGTVLPEREIKNQ